MYAGLGAPVSDVWHTAADRTARRTQHHCTAVPSADREQLHSPFAAAAAAEKTPMTTRAVRENDNEAER